MNVQNNTLLLADVFANFRNLCLKIYELDPARFLTKPALEWREGFKKDQSGIRSFNWYQYVINERKCIREGIYHSIYWYAKANNKYMKDYYQNKESSYLQ